MDKNAGSLFVLEGPDNAGKTTLARRFAEVLKERGHKVILYSFPGREPGTLGELVYRVHHSPEGLGITQPIDHASLQILHVAAHVNAVNRTIGPAIESGVDVVLDRYWWSTWVYGRQGSVPAEMLHAMLRVEELRWEDMRPTLIFLIRRSLGSSDPMLLSYYQELAHLEATRNPLIPIVKVDNDGSIDEALRDIVSAFEGLKNG